MYEMQQEQEKMVFF